MHVVTLHIPGSAIFWMAISPHMLSVCIMCFFSCCNKMQMKREAHRLNIFITGATACQITQPIIQISVKCENSPNQSKTNLIHQRPAPILAALQRNSFLVNINLGIAYVLNHFGKRPKLVLANGKLECTIVKIMWHRQHSYYWWTVTGGSRDWFHAPCAHIHF